ncbi:hypothetical protein D3C77_475850 [compost metagenome]
MKLLVDIVLYKFCGTIMINTEMISTISMVAYSFFLASTSLTPRKTFVLSSRFVLRSICFVTVAFSCEVPKRMASAAEIFRKRLSTLFT